MDKGIILLLDIKDPQNKYTNTELLNILNSIVESPYHIQGSVYTFIETKEDNLILQIVIQPNSNLFIFTQNSNFTPHKVLFDVFRIDVSFLSVLQTLRIAQPDNIHLAVKSILEANP